MKTTILIFARAFAVLAFGAGAAQAQMTICNKAGTPQTVGMAYKAGKAWFSEGWWTIDPEDCKVLVAGALQQRDYYYTLKNDASYTGQGYAFCAKDESYELTGADGDCAALGATARDYTLIDTGETATSFTFDLTQIAAPAPPLAADSPAPSMDLPAAAMSESFTPGLDGEPFFITARLQGCADDVSYWACSVVAEGWIWDFDVQGAHNDAAIDAMRNLPINTMLYVSGDVIEYNDITVVAQVAKIQIAPPDAHSATLDMMQGRWVSSDDPQSVLEIKGSLETRIYGGEVVGTALISFADGCPDGVAMGSTVMVSRELGMPPEDALCYAIDRVDGAQLEMMYLPRGNILSYARE